MNVCSSCGAPVRWVRMESGKRNPLNAAPDRERGNVVIESHGPAEVGVVLTGEELEAARRRGEATYLSHFADCKFASQHRKKSTARERA